MGRAKDIRLKVIRAKAANEFVKKWHYSGKVVQNSSLHLGAFLDGKMHGVMQFGSPLDKRKVLPLVEGTMWNEMLELNRMAFNPFLPRNSESRCIAMAIKLLKKNAAHIKWILSFADGTQCGDGTIYRASGFVLSGIRENKNTAQLPNGEVLHKMTLESSPTTPRKEAGGETYFSVTGGKYSFSDYVERVGGRVLTGFQLRYIYLIDKTCKLTVPPIPFSEIEKRGAKMYKGKKQASEVHQGEQSATSRKEGGSNPTRTL